MRVALLLTLGLAACSPSLSPLYRDYEVHATPAGAAADVPSRLRAALAEAGWTEVPADAPNVLSTAPRQVSNTGLYRVEVSVDLAPVGERFVRVFFHPWRYSLTGGRSKLPYLTGGVRRAVLPALTAALERQGFVVLGTPRERDREETGNG
ncbi:MAG TPA: hypothetical protein VD962_00100 [Rubricoccaceae bacterium]|nr:hypothetical protein [Rubricoccaceae bacterium]